MTDLQRYSRHLVLPQIDVAGQQTLLDSRALVVGAGGLGSAAALYLAAAGVGHLTIADSDTVELSNLQRQILHRTSDIGRPKAESARDALHALNPEVEIAALAERLAGARLQQLVSAADIVLDGSDNFPTRFAVNAACVAAGKPLVSGAAIRFEAQLVVFTPGRGDSPCYRCLYRDEGEAQESCENAGIVGPLAGVVGSLQALEAIKLLLGIGAHSAGRVLVFDALGLHFRELKLKRDPDCPICANRK